jgi:hypothetical protein
MQSASERVCYTGAMSNFLGDPGGAPPLRSAIISTGEMVAREGEMLTNGMNFRDHGQRLSVFLVLERDGEFYDAWDAKSQTYTFRGHDSTTVEGGKEPDQLLMYPSGKPTENGLFYKAAKAFKDGIRTEPLQVQVYEKLEMGVWFDKGIFNLIDAHHVLENDRKVYEFYLSPADADIDPEEWDEARSERLIPARKKAIVWVRDHGRCVDCGSELDLHFERTDGKSITLKCGMHLA